MKITLSTALQCNNSLRNNNFSNRQTDQQNYNCLNNYNFVSIPIIYYTNNINFGNAKYSQSLQSTIDYINKKHPQYITDLSPKEIKHILEGIDLFKGLKVEDLYLFPGIIDVLTQRGCSNTCLHCFIKARTQKVSMMWEDFLNFTQGLKELKKRLGFHVFEIKRENYDVNRRDYTISQGLYSYLDADPIEIKLTDKTNKAHYFADLFKQYYEDLGIPLKFKTAGWDKDNFEMQKAAESLVKLLNSKKYENSPPVIVSLHPFQKIMTKANKALNNGDLNEYNNYKNLYIDRMSNVFRTFLPLAKKNKLLINPQYAVGGLNGSGYTKADTKQLCKDILTQLESECKSYGEDCSFFTKEKDIEQNKFFEALNPITSVVRAKRQFLAEYSLPTYSFERGTKSEKNIVVSPFDLKHAFGNEVSENIVNNIKNQKKFIDNIVIDINPLIDLDLNVAERNSLSLERKELFPEKILYTIKRFASIDNLVLRLNYDNNSQYNKTFADNILKEIKKQYPKLKNIEYIETTKPSSLKKIKNSKDAFLEIVNNLDEEGKFRFVSQLRKGVNVDGQVYIPVLNTRSFGEDFFENRALVINGLKLNLKKPQKYEFDKVLHKNSINVDTNQVYKVLNK